ncbi:hypothetical protein HX049_07840 [Myroides odoratimimus]|uniref:hypothetical protein n=1 Tax=Myroides odoratimimus TaxID=76832 RepID=UPI002575902C|nr:hypothetical protein [Myroides odoratimimus]MDM1397084.1 hypothetical protein [Myroides odoratimimus]
MRLTINTNGIFENLLTLELDKDYFSIKNNSSEILIKKEDYSILINAFKEVRNKHNFDFHINNEHFRIQQIPYRTNTVLLSIINKENTTLQQFEIPYLPLVGNISLSTEIKGILINNSEEEFLLIDKIMSDFYNQNNTDLNLTIHRLEY